MRKSKEKQTTPCVLHLQQQGDGRKRAVGEGTGTLWEIRLPIMTPLSTFKTGANWQTRKHICFTSARRQSLEADNNRGRRHAERGAELREREIATFDWAPGDEEIAPLRVGSPSPMSRPRRFCFEVDHPQLLAIHLTCDSLAKCDELHRRARNNALNFCSMELLFVWLQKLCEVTNDIPRPLRL